MWWEVGSQCHAVPTMSLFTEPELSWQPWQPRRHRVLSSTNSSHGLLSGGGCLTELLQDTSESGRSSHLAVLPCPFSRENASDLLFSGASMLVGHVRMSDCVQGIEPCECKWKGHRFQRLGFLGCFSLDKERKESKETKEWDLRKRSPKTFLGI